jgi:hypothetical protein
MATRERDVRVCVRPGKVKALVSGSWEKGGRWEDRDLPKTACGTFLGHRLWGGVYGADFAIVRVKRTTIAVQAAGRLSHIRG